MISLNLMVKPTATTPIDFPVPHLLYLLNLPRFITLKAFFNTSITLVGTTTATASSPTTYPVASSPTTAPPTYTTSFSTLEACVVRLLARRIVIFNFFNLFASPPQPTYPKNFIGFPGLLLPCGL
jgi:hypothetical protein